MRNLTALLILWTLFTEHNTRSAQAQKRCPQECECRTGSEVVWCFENAVKISRNGGFWEVKCQQDDNISCDAFPQLHFGRNSTIDLRVDHCPLAVLHCLPRRLAASDVRQLDLHRARGANVAEDFMRGMHLESFKLHGDYDSPPIAFPREALSQHPKLSSVTFKEVNLSLHGGDLGALPALRVFMLTDAHLRHLPLELFRYVSNLEELTLNRNEIEEIPDDLFDGLTHLRVLQLSRNNLTSLTFLTRVRLTALAKLNVADNWLVSLPRLSSLTGLVELHLNTQKGRYPLAVSPLALSNLSRLATLSLRSCRLSDLPHDVLQGSYAIRDIDLSQNQLEILPAGLFTDQNHLETLNLDRNRLTSLPAGSFAGLAALKTLSVRHNHIEEVCIGVVSNLTCLLTLRLSHNSLRKIAFQSLPDSLQVLALDHNHLSFDDSSTPDDHATSRNNQNTPFSTLLSLRGLTLSHNGLTTIPRDLSNLKRLNAVDLSHNNITDIWDGDEAPKGTRRHFEGTTKKTILHSPSNNITIDLRHNQISNPVVQETAANTAHRIILLDNNPLHCDCTLYNLAKQLQGHTIYSVGNAKCAFPDNLKGSLVRTLSLKDFTCRISEKNNCSSDCLCQYRPQTDAIELNCVSEPKIYPNLVPNAMYEIRFRQAVTSLAMNIPNIRKVNLSGLAIDVISIGDMPETVQELDLSNNSFSRIPAEMLMKNVTLRLAGNPFRCDCWHKGDIYNLQEHSSKIADWVTVTCSDSTPLQTIDTELLCSTLISAAVGGTLAFVGFLVAAVAAIVYFYSFDIKVYLYARGLCSCLINEQELDKDKKYDAFISFCHEDEEFVVGQLLPGLESEPNGYTICVHFRDWTPGEWIPAQIATSVANSRRTIVVVSKNSLDSEWSRLEFRTARTQAIEERHCRVIVVLLEDVTGRRELDAELRAYLSTNTYLKWGDPLFWQKLRYAMPHEGVTGGTNRKAEANARRDGHRLAMQLTDIEMKLAEK